jgi:hypothetical protein
VAGREPASLTGRDPAWVAWVLVVEGWHLDYWGEGWISGWKMYCRRKKGPLNVLCSHFKPLIMDGKDSLALIESS